MGGLHGLGRAVQARISPLKPLVTCCKCTSSQRFYSEHANSEALKTPHENYPVPNAPSSRPTSDITGLFSSIRKILNSPSQLLTDSSRYHFDGLGKAIRPDIVILTAKAFNFDAGHPEGTLLPEQTTVAKVSEMIHTASLVHDDIIDGSDTRRGKPSLFSFAGQGRAVFAGDNILAKASMTLAHLHHNEVMKIMSEILENLVQGEFMQLGTKENEDERFNHYIEKSYRKTASLIANSCKAAVVLGGCTRERIQQAFEYGKSIGIAFQLVDDLLDYISNEQMMGKPTAADLKLGLATAPVLFASHEYPELNPLIMRRFTNDGDVQRALELVSKSSGVEQTKELALRYGNNAAQIIKQLKVSTDSQSLEQLNRLLHRKR